MEALKGLIAPIRIQARPLETRIALSAQTLPQSSITTLISSEFPFNSGAYIADARAGSALNRPRISTLKR